MARLVYVAVCLHLTVCIAIYDLPLCLSASLTHCLTACIYLSICLCVLGENVETENIVVKFLKGRSGHSEVKLYPYSLVAKVCMTVCLCVCVTECITAYMAVYMYDCMTAHLYIYALLTHYSTHTLLYSFTHYSITD